MNANSIRRHGGTARRGAAPFILYLDSIRRKVDKEFSAPLRAFLDVLLCVQGVIIASTEELVVSRPARIRVQIHTPKGSIEQPCIADPRRACCAAICRCLWFFAPLDLPSAASSS